MIELHGRTALVTGAAGGIGFGVADMLARAGARVAVNDIGAEAAEAAAQRLGGNAFAVPGNVTEASSAAGMIAAIERMGDGLDILVNNAGIAQPLTSLASLEIEDWQRVIDVNLRGAFVMSRAASAGMIARGRGAIINISSIAGMTPFPASHAYGVSKAGVVMLTQTLASELARHGIRVNAVAPGMIAAPMLEKMQRHPGDLELIVQRVPLGRLGRPEEIGRAVAFLASNAADYITGAVLPVDGGWLSFGGAGAPPRVASKETVPCN